MSVPGPRAGNEDDGRVAARHHQFALREVHRAGRVDHEHESERDQCVERSESNPVDDQLNDRHGIAFGRAGLFQDAAPRRHNGPRRSGCGWCRSSRRCRRHGPCRPCRSTCRSWPRPCRSCRGSPPSASLDVSAPPAMSDERHHHGVILAERKPVRLEPEPRLVGIGPDLSSPASPALRAPTVSLRRYWPAPSARTVR